MSLPGPSPSGLRLWGIYLIPRDRAPDEGYILTRNSAGKKVWRAHHVDQIDGNYAPPGLEEAVVTSEESFEDLLDQIEEERLLADVRDRGQK